MQCKDIPDRPILEFLFKRMLEEKMWCCWFDGYENSIGQAMPENTPDKVKIHKMAILIKRGLVDGCPCGCRGDYEISDKGIEWLGEKKPIYEDTPGSLISQIEQHNITPETKNPGITLKEMEDFIDYLVSLKID